MGELIVYATKKDAELIRGWINSDADIAWIEKISEKQSLCQWRAVAAIEAIQQQQYALWHVKSGALNIPSRDRSIPDAIVGDPFKGWEQLMEQTGSTLPWFGGNLPGPYTFHFREEGKEASGSLALQLHFIVISESMGSHDPGSDKWRRIC